MKKILRNEEGLAVNLALAMVLIAVAVSSMVSLVNMINDDRNTINWMKDRFQQELLLRAESKRINYMLERSMVILPKRTVEIVGRDRVATHMINHRRSTTTVANIIGVSSEAARVEVMCATKHSRRHLPARMSPVKSFMEKLSRRSSLAQYQYFSDIERSDISDDPNSDAAKVRFAGSDELFGPVHSNDDIWIRNIVPTGGTAVNQQAPGWPLFHDIVTTAGKIKIYPSGATLPGGCPVDLVFLNGYKEEVPPIAYEPDAKDIKRRGAAPFGLDEDPNLDIIYLDIRGNSLEMKAAKISHPKIDTFVVYTSYPDALNPNVEIGDSLWTNYIALPDTIWTPQGNLTLSDRSAYFPADIWVKGTVSGKMTLG